MKPFTSAWVADVLAARRADQLPDSAVVAAFALIEFVNFSDHTVKAAQSRVAASIGCSERHLRRIVGLLITAGLVKLVRGHGEGGRFGRTTFILTTLDHGTQTGTVVSYGPSDIARHTNHRTRLGTIVSPQYLEPMNEPVVRTNGEESGTNGGAPEPPLTENGNRTNVPASWVDTGSHGRTLVRNLVKAEATPAEANLIAERLRPAFDAGRVKPSMEVVAEELRRVRKEGDLAARDAEAERRRKLEEAKLAPLRDSCQSTHRDVGDRRYWPNGLCEECEQRRADTCVSSADPVLGDVVDREEEAAVGSVR